MRTIIIANGDPPTAEDVRQWLRDGDRLMCADGGGKAALALGLAPHAVVGDFDSLDDDDLRRLEQLGARLHRYPARKDETDLELALIRAAETGGEIIILGALGGRLDQTIANVMLLAMPCLAGLRALIAGGSQQTFLITPAHPADVRGEPGDVVSLIPFGGDAHGIRTAGLEYPLRDESLFFGPARGVSNVMLGEQAGVTVREGKLVCVHSSRGPGQRSL